MAAIGRAQLLEVSRLHPRATRSRRSRVTAVAPRAVHWWAAGIGTGTLVSRLLFAAGQPSTGTGVGLVTGIRRFDVTAHSPDAPGAWLTVAAGHALHSAFGLSPTGGLVGVAALASAAAAACTCMAGWAVAGRVAGIGSGLVVLSSPFAWFAGSTASTAAADEMVGAALLVLALRARSGRRAPLLAVVVWALGAGLHPVLLVVFFPLAVVAVLAGQPRPGDVPLLAGTTVAALAAWLAPSMLLQPGGPGAWLDATRHQLRATLDAGSVLAGAAGAGHTVARCLAAVVMAVGPTVAVAVVAMVLLGAAAAAHGQPGGDITRRIWSMGSLGNRPLLRRPPAVLLAALVPPLLVGLLVSFGPLDVVALLPAASVAAMMPVARVIHDRRPGLRHAGGAFVTILLGAVIVAGVQRFVVGDGVLPASVTGADTGIWLSEASDGAPYRVTADAITTSDELVDAVHALGARLAGTPGQEVAAVLLVSPMTDDELRLVSYGLPGSITTYLADAGTGRVLGAARAGSPVAPARSGIPTAVLLAPPSTVAPVGATDLGQVAGLRAWLLAPGSAVGALHVGSG